MSKKRRAAQAAARAATVAAPAVREQAGPSLAGGGGFLLAPNGWQAAGDSASRGYVYWPSTDTRRQMTPLTRTEIHRRIQWLYAHFGFCRRLVNGMARLLGILTPQPNTSDEDWNELAVDAFMAVAGSAQVWDLAGKFDFFQSQIQDNISIFKDGDGLAVMTETQSGRARFAYYEAHQIHNGTAKEPYWVDGVRVDRGGRHIAYRLRDGEDPNLAVTVDARDAIYLGAFDNRGQVRAMSILTTAVLNMMDVVETRGFTKKTIKNHSRMGSVIERDAAAPASSTVGGFGGVPTTQTVTMPDGSTQTLNMELVYQGSTAQTLPPGHKLKLITDDSPSPNNREFERALLQDCAFAADLSYEVLCDIAGITGPGIRFLNAELKRWIALRQYGQAKRCNRQYAYVIAKEIKSGRLREPQLKPGEMWWQSTLWIGMPAMDIDAGRTAQATVTDLQSGQTTWLERWGEKGTYWKRAIRQGIAEVAFAKLECARYSAEYGIPLDVREVFPQRFGNGSPAPINSGEDEPAKPVPTDDPPDADDPAEGTD